MSESDDPRLLYIKNTTLKLLNASDNQWAELIWKEENQAFIKDFLETPTSLSLLIYLDHNEKLLLSLEFSFPRYIPSIIAYFMKKIPVVTSENFKKEIMVGNVCNLPLNQYKNLFEMVLCPIFSHGSNNNRWPAEIATDIILHMQDFKKILTYHVSVAQSKTVLVIPEIAKSLENYDIDEVAQDQMDWGLCSVINTITDMVCDWIPIIKEILDVTPESILLKVQQGPASELLFWENHKENLMFIQQQLSDPLIEKMICALEKTGNPHYSLFKNLLQDVVEALTEANEISENLSAMSDQLKKIEACEFTEIKESLFETVKLMTASWTNSKYFSKVPSRISVLIQKFCFFLIEKVENYLNPTELFREEVSQMKNKVEICIETLNTFLQSYVDCQENYKQDNKIYPWVFPDQRVFDSLKKFLERLNKVYDIFEASVLYCSIPDYKIFGISLVPFKMRLSKLSELFKEYYQVFVESAYNPLDLKSDEFLEDYNMFSSKVHELDQKLGTALSQACLSCITSEDSFKVMKLVENLLNRLQVNLEFRKQITSLWRNIYMELLAAKDNYDKSLDLFQSDTQIIYKHLQSMSEKVRWSMDLQKRLSFPMYSLQHIQQYCSNDDNSEWIIRTHKEVQESLQKFQGEIFSTWDTELNFVEKQLNEPLFSGDGKNLQVNFSPQILNVAQEIQYMDMSEKLSLLPSAARTLGESIHYAVEAHFLLASTLQCYNDLIQNLMDFEINLIEDDWEKICQDLKTGLDENWIKDDLPEYSENIYEEIKLLHEKINETRKNVREVQEFIEGWSKSPVFVRETSDSIMKFDLLCPKMQQIYDVKETSIKMNRVMELNLQLFECDPESDKGRNYILYLDSIIETGLKDSIQCSLQYLAENTNRYNKKLAPFFKIKMILRKSIAFIPSLNQNDLGSFFTLFEAVIKRIYAPASAIKCLADPEMDYSEAIAEDHDLDSLKDQVIQHIESGINHILDHSEKYQLYSDIWLQDIDEVLEDFVLYGPHEIKSDEAVIPAGDVSLEIRPPSEEEFKTEITKFEMLQKKIEEIPSEILIESWLILDTTSFKESLLFMIRSWSSAYKKKLVELKSQDKLRKDEYDGD